MPRQKNYCFTLNNYTEEDIEALHLFQQYHTQYLEYSKEVGASGTSHLQGFMILKREASMKTLKQHSAMTKVHLEVMRGSPLENQVYVNKQTPSESFGQIEVIVPNLEQVCLLLIPQLEKTYIEGITPEQCKLNLHRIKVQLYRSLLPECPIQCIRHRKGIMDFITDYLPDEDSEPIYIEGLYHLL